MGSFGIKTVMTRLSLASAAFFFLAAPSAYSQCRILDWLRQDHRRADPCVTVPSSTSTPDKPPVTSITDPTLAPVTTAALGDSQMAYGPGYIDNAVPFTHFRLRFDSAFRGNRPDRAEYFYAKCGCFGGNAKGPPLPETSVDYQDLSAYLEYAMSDRFSLFVEAPLRFLNPDNNANTTGLADINTGFKYALISDSCRTLTFQGRIFIPTGDPDRGLGTDHVSLEPSILFAQNLSDRLVLFGQFGDWIPVGGTDFAGNILRYGVGVSYNALDNGRFTVAPVVEMLGWTVLGGKELAFPEGVEFDASGDTIINGKIGVRIGFGGGRNGSRNSDLYIGYGRALTGEVWYKEILRLEYRVRF